MRTVNIYIDGVLVRQVVALRHETDQEALDRVMSLVITYSIQK